MHDSLLSDTSGRFGTNPPARASEARATSLRGEPGQHWSSLYAGKKIHLIGISGCGMRGLAGVLLRCGARVSGSDRVGGPEMRELASMGATVEMGQAPSNIPAGCDTVVYSAAIRPENPELVEARRRGLSCLKYSEMLGQVMALRTGVCIAGTHGKSTTTAMTAFIMRQARLDPTFVVGATVTQLGGSSGVGDGTHFVVEACEFDQSFLNYRPDLGAILNIEEDHLDCYPNLAAIIEAFRAFAARVPRDGVLIANGADRSVAAAVAGVRCHVESFGFDPDAHWAALNLVAERGCHKFDIVRAGEPFVSVTLPHLPGRHHVGNALVAAALAAHGGVPAETIAAALAEFRGAQRRLTHVGTIRGIDVYDDYGHHPTEVQVTLRALRDHLPGRRLWVVFQPHQHSRTRFLLNDFARSFGAADKLLVPDIYFVRDSQAERDRVCSSDLVERVRLNGGDARYFSDFESIIEHVLTNAAAGDVVLTMGAGDIWKLADELVRRLA